MARHSKRCLCGKFLSKDRFKEKEHRGACPVFVQRRNELYKKKLAEWDERLRPETEAIRRSEILTAEDYSAVCR